MYEQLQNIRCYASPRRVRPDVAWISVGASVLLLLALPSAGGFRSPGDVSKGWWLCVFGDALLLGFAVICLKLCWRSSLKSRLLLYSSLGIGAGVAIMLADILYMQQQFDHWAHLGISYFGN
jgi:hypothetical protein